MTISDPPAAGEPESAEPGADVTESGGAKSGGPESAAPSRPKAAGRDYHVLARKYRPDRFGALIGQEALVRTLTNAFAANRVAHAFLLTGVRGVGKTTTARLIARALNCIGPDGQGGMTVTPCNRCQSCRTIAADRHVDVIEVDAASRTGVDDIREILDGVRYLPASARFKVYIIDEVHMLSRHAFNALLKTLEEPPERVKFIFATTESRKVPVTVLSRCQRFDLRRIPRAALTGLFGEIVRAENVAAAPEALRLIARAADGSARDGLSLLDQAISHGAGTVTAGQVRDMLGLADARAIDDLFDSLMRGDIRQALARFETLHNAGADPLVVVQDLLGVCHGLTRLRVAPETADATADAERGASHDGTDSDGADSDSGMASRLPVAALSRAWQILLKGLGEVQAAPDAKAAADMVLIRLAFAADLPTPGALVRQLTETGAAPGSAHKADPPPARDRRGQAPRPSASRPVEKPAEKTVTEKPVTEKPPGEKPTGEKPPATVPAAPAMTPAVAAEPPVDFEALVAELAARREMQLRNHLYRNVGLVHYEPGRLEFQPLAFAPADLAGRLLKLLRQWYGPAWQVSVATSGTPSPSLADQAAARHAETMAAAESHPLVVAARKIFPGATIETVQPRKMPAAAGPDTVTDQGGERPRLQKKGRS